MDLLKTIKDTLYSVFYVKLRNKDCECLKLLNLPGVTIKSYNKIKCKYCNQGLIPFKTLVGDNVTYYHKDGKEFCTCDSSNDIIKVIEIKKDGKLSELL